MFPSSFRPVSENRHLRKLSNVHSPMCIMSCLRFGNFFSRQICKVFFSWNAFVRWFSHLSWGTKALRAIQAQATCIGATTCCWLASVVLQSVLSRRTFLVEMSMWLVKSRAGLVLEKRHFYFVMLFLFFFSHLVYLDWDTTVKISSQEEGWGHLASDWIGAWRMAWALLNDTKEKWIFYTKTR